MWASDSGCLRVCALGPGEALHRSGSPTDSVWCTTGEVAFSNTLSLYTCLDCCSKNKPLRGRRCLSTQQWCHWNSHCLGQTHVVAQTGQGLLFAPTSAVQVLRLSHKSILQDKLMAYIYYIKGKPGNVTLVSSSTWSLNASTKFNAKNSRLSIIWEVVKDDHRSPRDRGHPGESSSVGSTQHPLVQVFFSPPLVQVFKSGLNKNRTLFGCLSFSLIISETRATNDPCLIHFVEDKGPVPATASGLGTYHTHYFAGCGELMGRLNTRGPQNHHALLASSLEILTAGGAS